jgi:hypothetical protein
MATDSKDIIKLSEGFAELIEKKGEIKDWSDSQLLKQRDRYRKAAYKNRGKWTFEFYECLQALNKESIKRNLDPKTDHK